ncbi:MAG: hypothetical protein ABEI58_00270 [Candidatus Nanohaloarchaea archaeon]
MVWYIITALVPLEYLGDVSDRDLVYLSGYFSQVREGLEQVDDEFTDTDVARALDGEVGERTVSRVLHALDESSADIIHNGGHIPGGVSMYEKNGYDPEMGDEIEQEIEQLRPEL